MRQLFVSELLGVSLALGVAGCPASKSRGSTKPTASARVASQYPIRAFNDGAVRRASEGLVTYIERDFSSRVHVGAESEVPMRRTWSFKSLRPVRRDKSGSFFHRFSLTENRFKSAEAAAREMNRRTLRCERTGQTDAKGTVSYQVVAGTTIHELQTDCLMNRHIERYVAELNRLLLRGKAAEPGSVIRYACGGNCSRL